MPGGCFGGSLRHLTDVALHVVLTGADLGIGHDMARILHWSWEGLLCSRVGACRQWWNHPGEPGLVDAESPSTCFFGFDRAVGLHQADGISPRPDIRTGRKHFSGGRYLGGPPRLTGKARQTGVTAEAAI
jgi:hypothetical protein